MEHVPTTGGPGPEAGSTSDATPRRRTAILVSGMHRSGTSALTRVISLLGARLPAELIEGHPGDNERGFWEGPDVVDLDEAVLDASGSWWCGWQSVDTHALPGRSLVLTRAREVLRDQLGDADLVVLKDPRMSRLLPLWTEALAAEGYDCAHVVAVRDPGEVAASVLRRNGLEAPVSELAWLAHLLDAERDSRGVPRAFVSFAQLMGDWEAQVARLEEQLGVTWPHATDAVAEQVEEFLEPDLLHPVGLALTVSAPVRDLFARWCVDDVRPDDDDLLDAWRERLAPLREDPSPTAHGARGATSSITQERLTHTGRHPWSAVEREAFDVEARAALRWLTIRLEKEQVTDTAASRATEVGAELAEVEDRAAKALHMLSSQATARVEELRVRAAHAAERRDKTAALLARARERNQEVRDRNQGLREQLQTARANAAIGRRARALVYDLLSEQATARGLRAADLRRTAVARLESSGLFDADDYLTRHPEAAESELSPAEHFLVVGRPQGHRAEPVREAPQPAGQDTTEAEQ